MLQLKSNVVEQNAFIEYRKTVTNNFVKHCRALERHCNQY